uniref:Toll-like receptor 21 n=1 Tax=Paramormyrops kingsleyae TaxID=1676925 RepID=A0A3B3QC44_9TELE|nr:toll-like receptor 13 [Paramormyrops kingsleyae]XP_023689027.1 toll-like receptor 13 [Paramormyrops kingsleyae]
MMTTSDTAKQKNRRISSFYVLTLHPQLDDMTKSIYIALVFSGLLFQLVLLAAGYSFQNCIENPSQNNSFNCIHRRQRNISALVGDLPSWATVLNVSHNYLQDIPESSFSQLRQLKTLRMDSNNLQNISDNAFSGLGHLETLNLSSNNIAHLSSAAFADLVNLTWLILSNNVLQNLSTQIFSGLSNLEILSLRANSLINFSEITESVTHLSQLRELDLCGNSLSSLQHFSGFPRSLAILYLCKNHLATLSCEYSFLSNIHLLDLSYNMQLQSSALQNLNLKNINSLHLGFTQVSPYQLLNDSSVNPGHVDFSGMNLSTKNLLENLCSLLKNRNASLHMLNLQNNGIRNLERAIFSTCPLFKTINLSHNKLKKTNCLSFLEDQKSLVEVILEHNRLNGLENCSRSLRFHNVTQLSYRYNRILSVKSHAFTPTPRLQVLKLNINNIAYMVKRAFKGLKDLITLRLDNNLLTDLYEESFVGLDRLQILNLRNNRIAVIFNKTFHTLNQLNILDLGGNKISHLQPEAFVGLKNLKNLYLDRNYLKEIYREQFEHVQVTLQVLDLQRNLIHFMSIHTSSPFVKLSKLQDLKLDGQQPFGITLLPHGFFQGLKSLKSLYLTNNKIYTFQTDTFDDLISLEFLSLDNCCRGVAPLRPGIFKNLRNLKRLSAENIGTETLSAKVFGNLTKLHILQLTHNNIKSVDSALLNQLPNLRYLDLRLCPLSCTCINSWLQNWTKNNNKVQLVYLYNLTCPDLSQSNFYSFDLKVCYQDFGVYLFATTSALLFLMTVFPLLYVKLYWHLKYTYYAFSSWFGEYWRRLQDNEEQWKYDAFISYNSADEKWVLNELLPNLEGRESSYRLCLHHRDFEVGRNIVDNIVSAIYASRKTLCVVSQHYLSSEWCSLEIQLASYRLFHEYRDVLILVFLEPISERQLSVYHRMRKVMLRKTYLQWPSPDCSDPVQAQELFWSQLRRALRSSSINQHGEKVQEVREEHCPINEVTDDEISYLMP